MSERPFAAEGPWCTICGKPGQVDQETLSPTHPLGRCGQAGPPRTGCGRVILTRIAAEAEAVWTARRRRAATRNHRLHLEHARRSPDCELCDAAERRVTPPHGTYAAGR